ncbi:MAG: hypothetical protein A3G32_10165 [Deltaproteobacteria bacterium RIFCSPLOWO2_12_FULL_40_28]|nr:MAG: hypothetical protein A3C45_05175 [Deltaproteobacteria bacterium RIFCSPHIGHO2_02_FULL_40_28]OGQ20393.1 MAG: hypothetical protein A3E27_00555 [Deltaproteobacteria bacterium RIFCSPHIGHO2_12_FULL_40_32]OGQ41362.1 MAG: hypothetical protein A3I69_02205 [Deltaproteobacteria bacterium RIFCSPLOWO2_02_FULL_40_36]OGQ55001.1 MAG: hypothetical protein A3G32_10165 [Deltaproteobacteria bacterium RIFCSPLOWO2_12_FULL_40_28]
MFHRIITPLKSSSFFLFGARGTGKTSFLKQFFHTDATYWVDLLEPEIETLFSKNPSQLKQGILAKPKTKWVILDEIQKVPKLLDVVHQLIESTKIKFALTGSSARKLKRGGANLLAGRAFLNTLYPLTFLELGTTFDLVQSLKWGGLPKIYSLTTDDEKKSYLKTYAHTYLKEEIMTEQIIRRLDPFRCFLETASQGNGEIINYSNIAKDVGADTKTVQSYYQILEDTLIGFHLPAYHKSIRKQQRHNPKFYFFDTGVKRALDNTLTMELLPNTYAFGKAFEHFLIIELIRLNDYYHKDFRFFYLRTQNQLEIDLIVERPGLPTALIEIKSASQVDERDTKTVQLFLNDFKKAEGFCMSNDPKPKLIDGIHCLPWQEGLQKIFSAPRKK